MESNFRTGVSERAARNERLKKRQRERERLKRNEKAFFKKNGRVSQWKIGAAKFQIKFGPTHRAPDSRVIDIENVAPRANSLASIRPITFSPSPFFDICLLLPRHETGYRRAGDTRLLLDGISNCNDSSPDCLFLLLFPHLWAETKLRWYEGGGGGGRLKETTPPPTSGRGEASRSSLSWLLSSPEYSGE